VEEIKMKKEKEIFLPALARRQIAKLTEKSLILSP
jgi:hypothetical protein